MPNLHTSGPDHAAEINAIHADLLSPAVLAVTWDVPAPPSMTLAPFEVYGYVNAGSPARLTYVYQAPVSLALTGGDGLYWLAVHADTATVVSGWTRRIGSHYLWRAAGTQPADPAGGLVVLKITVAGGVITALDGTLAFPSTRLAVGGARGQLTYTPQLTWNGSTLTVAGAATVTGNILAGNQIRAVGSLASDGPATLSSTLSVSGLTTLSAGLNVTGNILASNQIRAIGSLASDGPATMSSTLQVDGLTNLGGGGGHRLNVNGNIYCTNSIGIGRGPEGGWSLTTNGGHLSYGAIQGNSSLYIATTGTFLGNVAVASTNVTTYQLYVLGSAGKPGGGAWADSSSRHLKRAITDIPDALGLLLAQRGRRYEWEEAEHARALPGPQYGFVADEVTLPQWKEPGTDILTVRGFEALCTEALRTIVARLEALEAAAPA